jgi:hypothetical protein
MAASTDADASDVAAAKPSVPQKLGTFGDLLQKKK